MNGPDVFVPKVAQAWLREVRATEKTNWLFVGLEDGDGRTGFGEATLQGEEVAVRLIADEVLPDIANWRGIHPDAVRGRLPFGKLPQAALSSAVLQALWDLAARRQGVSLAQLLGGASRPVPVYANINRRTRNRSPEKMSECARDALAAGHDAIKIAPFDEVLPTQSTTEMARAAEPGLRRTAAVRDAIGAARLMVDCHWRFDTEGAARMIDAVAPLALHWVECPIAETEDSIPAICALRIQANRHGIRLAGLETRILAVGFRPYLEAGTYDVMMPDVKYAGGPSEMLRIATEMRRHGVIFSPHNPSGPVCHAHSLQICATVDEADRLEMQFDETPVFDALVRQGLEHPAAGSIRLPDAPGIGVALDPVAPREVTQ